jgi:hypothetical protein
MIEPNMSGIISLIIDISLELQILLVGSIVCALLFLVSEKYSDYIEKKKNNYNPFSQAVDLTAKQIKQIKEYNKNDKH